MGQLPVLSCPCLRENANVTCKIVSLLRSLDKFLLKNVIGFFFGNQISKWRSFKKKGYLGLLFTFCSHQGKDTKIPSAHPTDIHVIVYPIHLFCLPNFVKKLRIYHVWFLFGVTRGVDFFFAPFCSIQ